MPLGENIGQAYIRIFADGSGLKESIKDSFDDQMDTFDQQGKRTSQRYSEAFAKEQASATNKARLEKAFTDSLARNDVLDQFIRGQNWTRFRARLGREFGEAGKFVGHELENDLIGGMSFGQLESRLGNLTREVANATRKITAEADKERLTQMREMLDLAYAMNRQHNDRLLKDRLDADKEWELQIADLERQASEAEAQRRKDIEFRIMLERAYAENSRRNIAAQRQAAVKLGQDFALLNREAAQLLKGDRNATSRSDLLKLVGNLRDGMRDLNIVNSVWSETLRDTERDLRRVNPALDSFIRSMDKTSDSIGRAFGKGSRNNFLNFIGGFTGGITNLATTLLPRMVRGLAHFGASLGEARREGRLLTFALGGLAKGFAGLVGLGAGVFGIIGPIMSVFSQLAGIVTALASSIGFALVGAMGSLPAVLLPAAAGIGTLALAFANLDKAQQKALKADVRPLTESFKTLSDVAARGVFSNVADQADRLAGVLDGLGPMFRGLGNAVSDVGDSWIQALAGDGFERWRDNMAIFLPDAVRTLGRVVQNTVGGFGGLFEGMIPFMRDTLAYLERITGQFSDWANSTRGQSEIVNFFERTKTSLQDLGDFLGSTRDLLLELMDAGQNAGDSLFGSMSTAIDGWVAKIRANPDILGDWFDSAESFGRVIGNLAVSLGKVFDALDNEFSRSAATFAFDTLATAITGVADILSGLARALGIGEDAMMGFAGQAAAAALIFPRLSGVLGNIGGSMSGFVGNLKNAETRMGAIRSAAGGLAGAAGLGALVIGMQQTNDAVRVLTTTLGGAATGFAVGGPWGALIGGTLGLAMGVFAGETREVNAALSAAREPAVEFADSLNQISGAATGATNDLILLRLEQLNALEPARALGIAQRDLVGYMKGNEGAIERVNKAMRGSGEEVRWTTDQYGNLNAVVPQADANASALAAALGISTRELRKQQREVRANALATERLSEVFKGVPEEVLTHMRAEGVPQGIRDVAKLEKRYDLVPADVKTLLEAINVEPTMKNVRRVIDIAKELDRQRPRPEMDADTGPFESKARNTRSELERLARIRAVSTIDADTGPISSAINAVQSWLNNIPDESVNINVTRTERTLVTPSEGRRSATGGIFGEQWRYIGEAGREAVVPLNRPLGEVDPSVRWLSAIAQGLVPGSAGPQKVVDVGGVTVVTPTEDPYAVATEVVNRIVGAAL
jgi:hypothetical protein